MKKKSEINILFLAKYAPKNIAEAIPENIYDKVYAQYHHKVYEVLTNNYGKIVSTTDPGGILHLNTEVDYIFSLYNKFPIRNSEIFISSVSEYLKIPYLGASPNIRALAEDKHLAKLLSKHEGVPTAQWKTYNVDQAIIPPEFAPPYFVKPRFGAASAEIDESSICASWELAAKKINELYKKDIDVILEEQIKGIYYTCPVLNNFGAPLFLTPIKETSTLKDNVVTHQQKRKIQGGLSREISSDTTINQILLGFSKKLFKQIQPLDYTRFDFIVDEDTGIPSLLEFNVCCNLGERSTIAQSSLASSISYEDLLINIVDSSMSRQKLISSSECHQL
ncbi:hypothetical protein [Enterococcus caccae]|uniref:ATP-grasp domain-containing protein n=1 Tax=Enterococcus caccae ATCC BAA-1240 TaxID=1158612 RepID=R3WPJ5_9ENTE|nr:hypothetical protein [Enterococcus caccae]EOL49342.1 hypothetical protein UC7_00719 [Enterococcus caccae ATCC BAA-1240]EOT56394.1 hypothetical protein I580_03194 [Enterococcus caccae ATCC BAA-1240]